MELVIWIAAGAALGWLAIAKFGLNQDRGLLVSMLIGIAGGVAGGKLVAPMLGAAAAMPGEFNLVVMIFVLATSAACLVAGNLVYNRFGF